MIEKKINFFLYALPRVPPQARGRLPYQTPALCIENGPKRQVSLVHPFRIPHYFPIKLQVIEHNKLQTLISIPFLP